MNALQEFQQKIGFKRTPIDAGDGGPAFLAFVNYASGGSPYAKYYREDFLSQNKSPFKSETEAVAAFIDWLIVNHWGEENIAAKV